MRTIISQVAFLTLLIFWTQPALAQQGSAEASCTQQSSALRAQISAATNLSAPTKQILNLLNDPAVCRCVGQKFRRPLDSSDDTAVAYFRVHAECMIAWTNTQFPQQCPTIYQQLLPLMGHKVPSDELVNSSCDCVVHRFRETLSADVIAKHNLRVLQYQRALEVDKRSGTSTASSIDMSNDPMRSALLAVRGCIPKSPLQ